MKLWVLVNQPLLEEMGTDCYWQVETLEIGLKTLCWLQMKSVCGFAAYEHASEEGF